MIIADGISKEYLFLMQDIYSLTLNEFSLDDLFEVEVNAVTKDEIKKINLEQRGIDKVTDVLSFPYLDIKWPFKKEDYPFDVNYETGRIMLGEIDICLEVSKEQAEEYGHSVKREQAFLFLHGLLHLLGEDHIKEEDAKKMFGKQESILNQLGIDRG